MHTSLCYAQIYRTGRIRLSPIDDADLCAALRRIWSSIDGVFSHRIYIYALDWYHTHGQSEDVAAAEQHVFFLLLFVFARPFPGLFLVRLGLGRFACLLMRPEANKLCLDGGGPSLLGTGGQRTKQRTRRESIQQRSARRFRRTAQTEPRKKTRHVWHLPCLFTQREPIFFCEG